MYLCHGFNLIESILFLNFKIKLVLSKKDDLIKD